MSLRAPRRIWIFLLVDLLRTGGMACAALVVIIAFAFSIRFLAEGKIDLVGVLRLTLLALVPMMQYALPFACGFAATMTYHRFASDNEAAAAMASGVSHRSMLTPALVSGVVLAIVMAYMAHQVIPRFLRSMEEVITRDLTGVFVRAIEKGESVRLGQVELHARDVIRAGPDPALGAYERLKLSGVIAATLSPEGKVVGYLSAPEVGVWLYQQEFDGEPSTTVQLAFRDAVGEGAGDTIRSGRFDSHNIRIPSSFSDDPKFLSFRQLLQVRSKPEIINKIEVLRHALVMRLAEQRLIEQADAALKAAGDVAFERFGGERVVITAAGLVADGERWRLLTRAEGDIRVDEISARGITRRTRTEFAWLEHSDDGASIDASLGPSLRLRIRSAEMLDDLAGDAARLDLLITGLVIEKRESRESTRSITVADALRAAQEIESRPEGGVSKPVRDAAILLQRKVDDLQREVTGKQNERAAYAIASMLTLLCGAVTALRRESSLTLPVYLWSFFPALAAVITISAGEKLTHKAGPAGLILLWGGVAILALYTWREYNRLVRP